jgi:hypothetical protein
VAMKEEERQQALAQVRAQLLSFCMRNPRTCMLLHADPRTCMLCMSLPRTGHGQQPVIVSRLAFDMFSQQRGACFIDPWSA